MFTDIGGKIQKCAMVMCFLGIMFSVILGIVYIVDGANLLESRAYEHEGKNLIISGLTTMFIGSLGSWAGSLLFYGFGELIERIVSIDHKLSVDNKNGLINAIRTEARRDKEKNALAGKEEKPQDESSISVVKNDVLSIEKSENTGDTVQKEDNVQTEVHKDMSVNSAVSWLDSAWITIGNKWVQCPKCGEKRPADFIRVTKKCPACGLNALRES